MDVQALFSIQGKTALITGGSGHLGKATAQALAQAGAKVAVLGLHAEKAEAVAATIQAQGYQAIGLACDVCDREALQRAREQVFKTLGPIDLLINAAGGNHPAATTSAEQTFFDLDADGINRVFDTNFMGTFQSCQVFARDMAERGEGSIVNISSIAAFRPMTRVSVYSAAKAAVVNFTQWLAISMAREYSPGVRVNALAPGFFLTEQNRFLLLDAQTGELTPRGRTVVQHTPAGRLGTPEDFIGTLLWLLSPASAFVTGTVIAVDGGFSCDSGV